jgi:molecular chaperone GrpE
MSKEDAVRASARHGDERSEAIDAAEREEFSAAAPPDPEAPGTGETSFADAQAPAAAERREAEEGEADEVAKWKDVAHRKAAEFENYRKRMARENAAASERGAARLVKELLPALDHFELALKSGGQEDEVVKGFAMIGDELMGALERAGVQRFSPEGEPFDPAEHEAMAQRPVEDAESGTVVEVYQQGYRINGSVLRPARVVVAE